MVIRLLIALIATACLGAACYYIVPNILDGNVDQGGPFALGAGMFMYGFLMMYMFNKKYRQEMDGPPPDSQPWRNPSQPPPDEAA